MLLAFVMLGVAREADQPDYDTILQDIANTMQVQSDAFSLDCSKMVK
jgi:hypothetical protein